VMKFNRERCLKEYARVATCFGINTFGMSDGQAADKAIEAVADLNKKIGIPEKLSQVGVTPEHLEELTEKAFLDGCHGSNPRECTYQDLMNLYKQVL